MPSKAGGRRLVFSLVLTTILVLTLTPTVGPVASYKCLICGDRGIADALANTILFLPLGITIALAFGIGRRVYLVPLVISFLIEFAQQFVPGRDPSLGDLVFNSLGGLAGIALVRTADRWLDPQPAESARLSVAAALFFGLAIAITGLLLKPDFPPTTYWGLWAPDLGHLEWYRAHLESVHIGNLEGQSGPMTNQPEIHQALRRGDPVTMRGTAGPPVTRLGALFAIYDERQREILLIGPRKTNLVLRYRTKGTAIGLDQPEISLPGAMGGLTAGDSIEVTYFRSNTGVCLELKERVKECGLGFTAGRGWSLINYDTRLPDWIRPVLDAIWLLALAIPLGFWTVRRWESATGLLLAFIILLALPQVTGLRPAPVWEIGAVAAGVFVGFRFRAWLHQSRVKSSARTTLSGRIA